MASAPPDPFQGYEPAALNVRGTRTAPRVDLGVFDAETWEASWNRAWAQEDYGINQHDYEADAADTIWKALKGRGYKLHAPVITTAAVIARNIRGEPSNRDAANSRYLQQQREFLTLLGREQEKDPTFLPQFAGVRSFEDLRNWAIRKRQDDIGSADAVLARASGAGRTIAGLGTGIVRSVADPTSFIPVPGAGPAAGFWKSVLKVGLHEGLANAGMALAQEPLVRSDARAMGIERTATDTAVDVGVQGLAGFAIGGISGGLQAGASRTASDRALRDAFDQLIPEEMRTADERAALAVGEDAIQLKESSPFEPDYRGDTAHAARMEVAAHRVMGRPILPRGDVRKVSPAEIAGGSPANVRHGERARYKAMVRQAESGGDDRAPAATSSAYGRYQPIKSTWLNWWKQRYPNSPLSDDQILAKRADGALQEVFMDDFSAANARALRNAGLPETAENLYLAHFLGATDAARVLTADPDMPIAGLVRGKSIAANRSILEGKTAGEVRQWSARKMGRDGPAIELAAAADVPEVEITPLSRRLDENDIRARMHGEVPQDGWGVDPDMPRLRTELFSTPEAHARAQIAMEDGVDAWEGFDIVTRWTDADEAATGTAIKARIAAPRGPKDLMQFIADKGGIRDGEGHDLKGMLDGNPYLPGQGALIREKGLSVDELRELAVEAGYFGDPSRTDITVSDLLDAIDQQHRGGQRRFTDNDAREMEGRRAELEADSQYQEFSDRLTEAAQARGLDAPTGEEAARAFDLWDGDFDQTLNRMIVEKMSDAARDAAEEAKAFRWSEPVFGAEAEPPAMEAGDPGLTPNDLARWDEVDGAAAEQMMSVEHDLRAWADADPEMAFALEEGSKPRALADIIADIDEEDAVIAALEACL